MQLRSKRRNAALALALSFLLFRQAALIKHHLRHVLRNPMGVDYFTSFCTA